MIMMTAAGADHIEIQMQLTMSRFEEWIRNDFFHLRWWLLLLLFITDVWLWWKLTDKSRLREILLMALISAVMVLILDELGEELTLWYYPTDVFPLFPPVEAADTAFLPFLYSLIYQRFEKWKWYAAALGVMSVFSCFVFEPVFIWLDMYRPLAWKIYYGLPLYFTIGVIAKAALSRIKGLQKRALEGAEKRL